MSRVICSFALLPIVAAWPLLAQPAPASSAPVTGSRQPVPASEWSRWESLGNGALSPDGKWVAYDLRRVNGPGELRYRAVGSATGMGGTPGEEITVRNGSGPVFTNSNHFLLYTILPDTAAAGRAGGTNSRGGAGGRGAGSSGAAPTASRNKVGIVDLRSGATVVLEEIQTFSVNKTGTHAALRRYTPTGRQSRGADLVVRDLEQGADVTLGNVAEFAWNDDGSLLGMTTDVEGKTGNGVQVLSVTTGAIHPLDAADLQYANLGWRPRSSDLVAFRSVNDTAFADTAYTVMAWRAVGSSSPVRTVYDFAADKRFPTGMRVASYRRPQWSDDGGTLYFGIASREPRPPATARTNGPAPARVEVWH
ncbi:MAG TPA: hypothetical protein VHE78_00225, partial [Gemmatimonadaceae bacterium]|nr:hypothetical protein [Gemmatimonadaceae bacterium]